jgi:hypothetical protein
MANSNYGITLKNSSGSNYFSVVVKDPTVIATAATTGTFLAIDKYHDTVNNADPVTIVAATNATPIVVSSTTNTLTDGDVVYIFGGLVNTGINGTFEVTSTSGTGFTLLGSRGTGTYTASSAKFIKVAKTPNPHIALLAAVRAILNDRATNG